MKKLKDQKKYKKIGPQKIVSKCKTSAKNCASTSGNELKPIQMRLSKKTLDLKSLRLQLSCDMLQNEKSVLFLTYFVLKRFQNFS